MNWLFSASVLLTLLPFKISNEDELTVLSILLTHSSFTIYNKTKWAFVYVSNSFTF